MMLVRSLVAAAVLLAAATGCRDTEWPSDADQAKFCEVVGTGTPGDAALTEFRALGTPVNLPFEARRYLLDLDEGKQVDRAGEDALTEWISENC